MTPPPPACRLEHNRLQLGNRASRHKLQGGVGAVEKVGAAGSYGGGVALRGVCGNTLSLQMTKWNLDSSSCDYRKGEIGATESH